MNPLIARVLSGSSTVYSNKVPVKGSEDLERILALPRRSRPSPEELKALADDYRSRFGKPDGPCSCRSVFNRDCAKELLPVQAWCLAEAERVGGILGPIGVGHGKTLLDLLVSLVVPGVKHAVLLIPPSVKAQLLQVDWEFYSQHWNLPSLAGSWIHPGRPVLRVIAYSELSSAKSTTLLNEVRPELIICDEAHLLKNKDSARTKRFLRYLKDFPQTKLCAWSGTLTTRSLKDFAHLSNHALHEKSPTPRSQLILEEWAGALDPGELVVSPGELERLCRPGEHIRSGFHRRLVDTFGVISSIDADSYAGSLLITKLAKPECPTQKEIDTLSRTWQRPDGEELVDAFSVHRCAKELASGFFYRWIWPRNEPLEVRKEWLQARKEWHCEMREKLKRGGEHMDSPQLVMQAAVRWYDGYVHIERDAEGRVLKRVEVPPYTAKGPRKTWAALTFPRWRAVKDTAVPDSEAVWLSDYLIQDVVRRVREHAIVWFESEAFGSALAKALKAPLYGAGKVASETIILEKGKRTIVASIKAHGTGKNLQGAFSRNVFPQWPSDGAAAEQVLGRTHRKGQPEDEVKALVYLNTGPFRDAFAKTMEEARYATQVLGQTQKLCLASFYEEE